MTGISSFLPPAILKIRDKEGIHGAISFCIRKPQACQTVTSSQHGVELVEAGFGALRHLNELGETLTKGLERRTMNSLVKVYSRAEFPVGQVVVHKRTGCRCVVVGASLRTLASSNLDGFSYR